MSYLICSSSECQARHWNEGHKNECRAPEPATVSDIAIMCNGQLPAKSKIVDGAKLLDRSSSGASSSDGTYNLSEDNLVSKQSPKPQSNHVTSDGSLARPKKVSSFTIRVRFECVQLCEGDRFGSNYVIARWWLTEING